MVGGFWCWNEGATHRYWPQWKKKMLAAGRLAAGLFAGCWLAAGWLLAGWPAAAGCWLLAGYWLAGCCWLPGSPRTGAQTWLLSSLVLAFICVRSHVDVDSDNTTLLLLFFNCRNIITMLPACTAPALPVCGAWAKAKAQAQAATVPWVLSVTEHGE